LIKTGLKGAYDEAKGDVVANVMRDEYVLFFYKE
jgi:hypothetical protein